MTDIDPTEDGQNPLVEVKATELPILRKATCIECTHIFFFQGDKHYSDETPGFDCELLCGKQHWEMSNEYDTEESLREKMLKAESCLDYCDFRLQGTD
ncbi:MAG: hypothetical protein O3B41_11750 [Bacteroidetes bacterium]|nr:hypothetical protein [Bacteroidota bacterium]